MGARAPLLAAAFVVLYFVFGYYVASRFPQVRLFYAGSTGDTGFVSQLRATAAGQPEFLPFQFVRGLLRVAFAISVVLVARGRREAAVGLAVLLWAFGLQPSDSAAQRLLPGHRARLAHFLETSTSTAVFGALMGWALSRAPRRGAERAAVVPQSKPAPRPSAGSAS